MKRLLKTLELAFGFALLVPPTCGEWQMVKQ
jgi:hypothetical protein